MIIVTAILDYGGAIDLPGWFYCLWIFLELCVAAIGLAAKS